MTVEEIEERRAQRKAASNKARAEQYAVDLAAVDELETKNGYELNISLRVSNFVPGAPSLVGVRTPSALEYKRFSQQLDRAGNADGKMQSHEQLAKACWVYPEDDDARKAMANANPGLLAGVGNVAVKLAEMETVEEGKG